MNVKQTGKRFRRFMVDHGADIFSVLAGIGVIATGITAYDAGQNAKNQATESESGENDRKSLLIRPVLCASGTIACIGAARYFGLKKEESLLAASAVLASYISRSNTEGGTECNTSNVSTSDDKQVLRRTERTVEDTGTGDIIFIEDFTGRRFKASWEAYEHAKQQLQYKFSIAGFVCLNDFYELLGLSETAAGEVLGWTVDQMIMDPYYVGGDMYYEDALTQLCIEEDDGPDDSKIIYYCVLPIGSLAGIGPCNQ